MSRRRRRSSGSYELTDPRVRRGRMIVVLALVTAGMIIAMLAFVDNFSGADDVVLPRIEVPSVKGLDLTAAHQKLQDLGFVVDVKFQPNEVVPKGQVFTQEPPPRAKAEQGAIIGVVASDGPVGVTAPNVVGRQVSDATAALQASWLRVEVVKVADEQVRAGEVVHTVPAPGQRVIDGTLHLQVSDGPAPRIVPDIVGKPIEVALAAIGHDGLNVGDISRVARPGQAPGTVLGATPPPGTGLPRNTPVALQVVAPPATTQVPYLVGLRATSATALLKTAGLTMTAVTSPVPAGDPSDGRIITQGFAPEADVPAGTAIPVTIGSASGVGVPSSSPTTTR